MIIPKDTPMSGEGHEILLELINSTEAKHIDHHEGTTVCGFELLNSDKIDDNYNQMFIDVFNIKSQLIVSIALCDGHSSEAKIVRL